MSLNNTTPASSELAGSLRDLFLRGGLRRISALAGLTMRESIRNRVLLGMTALMLVIGILSLFWPADVDAQRVILVQRFCFSALTLFGFIAIAFIAGSALPVDFQTKRIYSVITKPISRLEILLGKVLGLLGILFLFMVIGGLVVVGVSYVANERKSFEGGSYSIEVTAPQVEVKSGGQSTMLNRGQVITVDAKAKDGFRVAVAGRDTSISGVVPFDSAVLRERRMELARVAEPVETIVHGSGITEGIENGELRIGAPEISDNEIWHFDIPQDLPGTSDVPVRFRFERLMNEPVFTAGAPVARRTARLSLEFVNPVTGHSIKRDIDFVKGAIEITRGERQRTIDMYDEIFVLPREVLGSGKLDIHILDYSPRYAIGGRKYYGQEKLPVWIFKGFNPKFLPDGEQTLRIRCMVSYLRGMDLVDSSNVVFQIRNPATGLSEKQTIALRDRTVSYLRFPRALIDDKSGVEVSVVSVGKDHRLACESQESPIYLMLKPDSFLASTARSIALIFLYLSIFVALAVMASTFLSAPVAILLVSVAGLCGVVKDSIMSARGAVEIAPQQLLTLYSEGKLIMQDLAGEWTKIALTKLLVVFAPGMAPFDSGDYITQGWSVPWSVFGNAAVHSGGYIVVCVTLGYLILRKKEME